MNSATLASENDLSPRKRFLLETEDFTFLSRIKKVTDNAVYVTVPFEDYPLTGMGVRMDFHDPSGCTRYETRVLQGPVLGSAMAILMRPIAVERVQHRSFTRVTCDLTIEFREMTKVKFKEAAASNVSASGLLMETSHRMTQGTAIEINIPLDKAHPIRLLARIVHVITPPRGSGRNAARQYGCHYTGIEAHDQKRIIEYVWDVIETTQKKAAGA
jgi:c-di-GMP-binding flagellar brake protein YcgR